MFDVFELQKRLVAAAGPSCREARCGRELAELARPFVDEIATDPLGNVICHKKGPGKRIFMPAHMDVIGFLATHVDDQGFVWFEALGRFSPPALVGESVVFENGTRGTVYLRKITEFYKKPLARINICDLYIDIGAVDAAEARSMVKLGDWAKYAGEPKRVCGDNIMTPYADNLAGCIALLLAMEKVGETPNDLYFAFTVQEEVNMEMVGSKAAAYAVDPFMCIAVDGCQTGDTPKNDSVPMEVSIGHGPTVKIRDGMMLCSPLVIDHLKAAAVAEGIAWQDEIQRYGGTGASPAQGTRGGVHSGCVSYPIRHAHSPSEIFNIGDVVNASRLIAAACRKAI